MKIPIVECTYLVLLSFIQLVLGGLKSKTLCVRAHIIVCFKMGLRVSSKYFLIIWFVDDFEDEDEDWDEDDKD